MPIKSLPDISCIYCIFRGIIKVNKPIIITNFINKILSKPKEKIVKLIKKASSIWSLVFFFVCILGVLILVLTVGLSLILKSQGKTAYQQKNYTIALEKFESAHKWWLIEKIIPSFKDNDLSTQLNKAKVMVSSHSAYEKGLEAFSANNYVDSKKLLSQIVVNDPNYQDAQIKLAECQEKLKPTITPTPTPKKILLHTIPSSSSQKPAGPNITNVNISGENGQIRAVLNNYWKEDKRFCVNVTVTNVGLDKTAGFSDLCNQAYLTDGTHNTSSGVTLASTKLPLANKGETVSYSICAELFSYPDYKVISIGCGPDSSLRLNIPQ